MLHKLWFDRPVTIPDEYRKSPWLLANQVSQADDAPGTDPYDNRDHAALIANRYWAHECLPLGNGYLGLTAFGDPAHEEVQFNEESLWVGNEHNTGAYQPFADIHVEMDHAEHTGYRRTLDLDRALQTITYTAGGAVHTRQYFISHPANVGVLHFTADQAAALSGRIYLTNQHDLPTAAEGNELIFTGKTQDLWYWKFLQREPERMQADRAYTDEQIIDLDFEARVRVLHTGGSVTADGNSITFSGCDRVTLLLAAGTSYCNRRDRGWQTDHPHEKIMQRLDTSSEQTIDEMLAEHTTSHQSLYRRVALHLGDAPGEAQQLPTPGRLARYCQQIADAGSSDDHALEALMYHYSRYLMICSSRPGDSALPANLQGIWLANRRPAWRCDFHTDINIQMNYWFADQANLPECFMPFAEWVRSIRDVRKEETQRVLGVERGWLMRSENGVFGGSTWHIQKGDSAWLCQNLWDHFTFTRDQDYLCDYAYPVMKEISHFWIDHLKALPDGTLVAPDGRSPEHGPEHADGVSYDQQLCWDLFNNTIEASLALGVDDDLRAELTDKRDRLLGPKVGRWGQLQEWMDDIDDEACEHRHTSHLIAVYPGRQISPRTTPELADAAKVSILARGKAEPAWAKAWRSCLLARLLEPIHSYRFLTEILTDKTHGNLWTTHPPFQIDGNFGYAAAVHEMLVQSHTGVIELLPALPEQWPSGHVTGLRLRGGYEADIAWHHGKLTMATLRGVSNDADHCMVSYAGSTEEVSLKPGDEIEVGPDAFTS